MDVGLCLGCVGTVDFGRIFEGLSLASSCLSNSPMIDPGGGTRNERKFQLPYQALQCGKRPNWQSSL